MPRLLTVPNFSTAVLPDLDLFPELVLHYARGDRDHGRSVVAFSGEPDSIIEGLLDLCARLLPRIDLRRQTGAHPRIGALDVAPFIDLMGRTAIGAAEDFSGKFTERFGVPVRMYGENGGASLPDLRRTVGGSENVATRWGTTVCGARPFLIAANLDFPAVLRSEVRAAAREIRHRRDTGDAALVGVRALAFDLLSQGEVQLSFNLTRPDSTGFDTVAEIGEGLVGAQARRTELIGVIRRCDLPGSTRLEIESAQIVD